jgi:hypothetical protein
LGIYLVVYCFAALCLGAALYWLMQPRVLVNVGIAAYQPPPGTVVAYRAAPWTPPAQADLSVPPVEAPAPVASAKPLTTAPSTVAGAKQDARQNHVRPRVRRQAPVYVRNPLWDYAFATSYRFRPGF